MFKVVMPAFLAAVIVGGGALLGAGASDTAEAQEQEGLVNVALVDTTVQVPIGVAANVCDVNVNVLSQQLALGDTACGADATASAVDSDNSGNGSTQQTGLVNIYAEDTTIQVPVGIAANLCDINANVLARQFRGGDAECDAAAMPDAEA